jgi:hypothetical protein
MAVITLLCHRARHWSARSATIRWSSHSLKYLRELELCGERRVFPTDRARCGDRQHAPALMAFVASRSVSQSPLSLARQPSFEMRRVWYSRLDPSGFM